MTKPLMSDASLCVLYSTLADEALRVAKLNGTQDQLQKALFHVRNAKEHDEVYEGGQSYDRDATECAIRSVMKFLLGDDR